MSPTRRREPLTAPSDAADGPNVLSLGLDPIEPPEPASEHQDEAPTRPSFTLSEAAKLTGRNRRTLRRWLDGGRFPNAYQADDDSRTWKIPAGDLGTAGLGTTPPDGAGWPGIGSLPLASGVGVTGADVTGRLRDLERQLAEERTLRQVAEARLDERAAQLTDLRAALEVLTRHQLEGQAPTPAPAAAPDPARRSWWKR